MINEERIIINSDIDIGATVAYQDKKQKRPLVVLIMGTGSLDRDGNGPGFKSNLYKDLSDMFVEMGYVCVRYDKRGTHESTGNGKISGLSDLTNDAANVIHYAKKLDYVDENKIVVCGHSEGAMITTLLTKKEDLKLQGIILLSGAATSLKDAMLYQNYLIVEQVQNMKGFLGWFLRKVIKKEDIEKQVSTLYEKADKAQKPTFSYRGGTFSTKYFQEHHSLTKEDYVTLLKEYKGKILAITGMSDVQADYRELEQISSFDGVEVHTPKELNHILRDVETEPNIMDVKKEYKLLLKKPISPSITDSISSWSNNL